MKVESPCALAQLLERSYQASDIAQHQMQPNKKKKKKTDIYYLKEQRQESHKRDGNKSSLQEELDTKQVRRLFLTATKNPCALQL